jgi:hypothetical protein
MSDTEPEPQPVPEQPSSTPRAPSIGKIMLEWALNVVVGFLLMGVIATGATYFIVGPNDRALALPMGIFVGITLGAVVGSKSKIIRLP